ncbi:MAG: hypothetical protein ACI4Q3_10845 [Kiritimatiellia bacterium]
MKQIIFGIFAVWSVVVNARAFRKGHFIVALTDNESRPITNATVYVKTLNRTGLTAGTYSSHYTTFSNHVNSTGVADVSFQFLTSHFDWWLETPEHHSSSVGFRSDHFMPTIIRSDYWNTNTNTAEGLARYNELKSLDEAGDYDAFAEKFESKRITYVSNTVYRSLSFYPKRNPQPMYSYGDMCNLVLPRLAHKTTNDNTIVSHYPAVSVDLKEGRLIEMGQNAPDDFVADFHLERCLVETNGVKNFYGRLYFEPGCGAYKGTKSSDESFPGVYEADTNHVFLSQLTFSTVWDADSDETISSRLILKRDEYMVLRTRMKIDENGATNGWHYSKIYGPILVRKKLLLNQSIFNPRFNDINLEFDVQENLADSHGQWKWP